MNNDLVNKVLDQAKTLQKTFGEAVNAGAERAHPLLDEAVTKAGDLKDSLAHSAAEATEAAKPHIDNAVGQVNHFISLGKSALETGVAKAHEQLDPLADQLRKTIESTTAAMAKKPEDASPVKESPPQP